MSQSSKATKIFTTSHLINIISDNRAEVSQKAAEVDTLNDQLTEERKRSRDLQWSVEKERCRTGRDEESKREELEVRGYGDHKSAHNSLFYYLNFSFLTV